MNTHIRSFVAILALAALSGCASSRSPLQASNRTPMTGGNGATLATSSAIGAAAGSALSSSKNRVGGAAVGGAVGLITGALIGNHNQAEQAAIEAEAYERGKRDGRVEVMKKYWQDKTLSPGEDADAGTANPKQTVEYPAGVYEGINFGPRVTDAPALNEPRR